VTLGMAYCVYCSIRVVLKTSSVDWVFSGTVET
jgi:hypothetical protein